LDYHHVTEYDTPPRCCEVRRRGRQPQCESALTRAERQARYRQRQADNRAAPARHPPQEIRTIAAGAAERKKTTRRTAVPFEGGTRSSNLLCSSEESAANSVQTLPPWRLPRPRRPPYFGPSRTAGAPRVASEGIVAITVDAHGCTSSAPPGSLGPSPWGRASGSLQGRVRPCSCSPPLVTFSSILRVTARSPCGDRSGLARARAFAADVVGS